MSQTSSSDSAGSVEGAYERDILSWARDQARLLEEGRFGELDLANLIEEVSSVGGSDRREIESRLGVLILHLLKWRYQPGRRTPSWEVTIRHQRGRIARVVDYRPSLKHHAADEFADAYTGARLRAAIETGLDPVLFPAAPPFTVEQALDPDFLP